MTPEQFVDFRKSKKMTQQQMADWLDVSKRRIQTWESGLHPVPSWAEEKLNQPPSLNPKLTLEQFQKLDAKAREQNKTISEVIADIIRAALLFIIGAAALWLLC